MRSVIMTSVIMLSNDLFNAVMLKNAEYRYSVCHGTLKFGTIENGYLCLESSPRMVSLVTVHCDNLVQGQFYYPSLMYWRERFQRGHKIFVQSVYRWEGMCLSVCPCICLSVCLCICLSVVERKLNNVWWNMGYIKTVHCSGPNAIM